jgi:nitrite reductase/ring-hydroxylating ferredoxin subunit
MPVVKVGSLAHLPPGSVMEVRAGGETYALCNVGGSVYALGGTCLHVGGPLGHGALDGHHVVCPWHMWEFDCRTGEYDRNPAFSVPTFPVRVEGDDILMELPDA